MRLAYGNKLDLKTYFILNFFLRRLIILTSLKLRRRVFRVQNKEILTWKINIQFKHL